MEEEHDDDEEEDDPLLSELSPSRDDVDEDADIAGDDLKLHSAFLTPQRCMNP
jgi:hypothetical protein